MQPTSTQSLQEGLASTGSRYGSLEQIGAGGMGVVYRAADRIEGRTVALKTLHELDARALVRLKAEFRSTADVVHPNLAKLYELASIDEHWFVVMEYVSGVSMSDVLQEIREQQFSGDTLAETQSVATLATADLPATDEQPDLEGEAETAPLSPVFDEDRVRDVFGQLAQGIWALHQAGKLHRDIKAGNVMIEEGGRVVLLDFGLISDQPRGETTDDSALEIVGTPAYMAPEQTVGMGASPASDWYAFGTMLFEVLAGQRPFRGTVTQLLARKQYSQPPTLLQGPQISDELVDLCNGLLAHNPERRPSVDEIFETLGVKSGGTTASLADGLLVGRQAQLAALNVAWEAMRAGRPQVVRLHGASGTGKSMLAEHFLDQLRRQGATVLVGRCYEHEAVPYKALDSLIDALAAHLDSLPVERIKRWTPRHMDELARVFPVFQRVRAFQIADVAGTEVGPDTQELRRRAFRGLKQLLGHMSDELQLVLHIDDTQWGDRDSGQMLNELLSPPDAPRVLVVLSYRSEEAAASPFLIEQELGEQTRGEAVGAHEVAVGPLNHADAHSLAAALLGTDGGDPRAKAIADQSHGIPFFVAAMARYALEGGGVESLEHVVTARVAALPEAGRRLLEAVSLATKPIHRAVAAEAAGGVGDLRGLIKELTTGHLIRSTSAGGDERLEAYHDRIRESVAASLEGPARIGQHRALAVAYESAGGADPEALFTHWFGAEQRDKAGPYAVLAGDRAAEALAFDTAADFYRRASELLPDEPSLAVKRADALVNAGQLAQAAPLYLDAAELASDPVEATALKRRAAEHYLLSGRYDSGLEVLQPLLKAAGLRFPWSPGWALFGLITRSIQLSWRGLDFTARSEDEIPRHQLDQIDLCWTAGKGLGSVDIMRGGYYIVRSAGLALDAGEPARISRGLGYVGLLQVSRGTPKDVASGEVYLDTADRVGEELGDPEVIGFARINRGTAEMTIGQWASSRSHLEAGIQMLEEQCTGVGWEISFGRAIMMCSMRFLGAQADLLLHGGEWLRAAHDTGDRFGGGWLHVYLAEARMALGDWETARAEIDETLASVSAQVITPMQVTGTVFATEIDRYRGRPDLSLERIDKLWKPAEKAFAMGWQSTKLIALLTRATARFDMATRGMGDRSANLAAGLADAKAMIKEERHYCRASGLLMSGVHAHLTGDEDQAVGHFAESASIYEDCDMRLYGAVARHRQGELLGGDEGAALVEGARAILAAERVRDIPRWLTVHAPGFDGA